MQGLGGAAPDTCQAESTANHVSRNVKRKSDEKHVVVNKPRVLCEKH